MTVCGCPDEWVPAEVRSRVGGAIGRSISDADRALGGAYARALLRAHTGENPQVSAVPTVPGGTDDRAGSAPSV